MLSVFKILLEPISWSGLLSALRISRCCLIFCLLKKLETENLITVQDINLLENSR